MKKTFTFLFVLICIGCGPRSTTTNNAYIVADTISGYEDCNDTAALKKIQDSLIPRVVLGMTEELYKELMADTPLQGLQSFDLDTTFNQHCLLSITATGEWSAAYIQGFQYYVSFDKRTGNKLFIKDLLKTDSLSSLLKQLYEIAEETARSSREDLAEDAEHAEDTGYFDEAVSSSLQMVSLESLENFYITPDGLTFKHEFGFGHAFWAIAPGDAVLNLSKEELQRYIKPDGPLSFWLKNRSGK